MKSRKARLQSCPASPAGNLRTASEYRYVQLDEVPLIINFELQLAQQREVEQMLRHIAAVIDFDLACLARGIDPRARGVG